MLNDGAPFSRIYLKVGRTDLRKGIDGLATIVKTQIHLDPFQKNVLFLFCGRSPTKIKGLLWEGLSAYFCYPHIFSFFLKMIGFKDLFLKNVRITLSTAGRRCVLVRLHRPAIQAPRFPMR